MSEKTMYSLKFVLLSCAVLVSSKELTKDLKCEGERVFNATATPYYPSHHPNKDGFVDMRGKKLRTLQDYIDWRARYVTVSLDPALHLKYGTKVCIPEFNEYYKRKIVFEVRDASDYVWRKGFSQIEICVRTREDTSDPMVNRQVTLVLQ